MKHALWVSAHPGFQGSERLRSLLVYLARQASENPTGKITQFEIATDVLKYRGDFDPVTNAHVRIEVRRLRDALDLFYARSAPEASNQIAIPKGQYAPVLAHINSRTGTDRENNRARAIVIGVRVANTNNDKANTLANLLAIQLATRGRQIGLYSSAGIGFQIQQTNENHTNQDYALSLALSVMELENWACIEFIIEDQHHNTLFGDSASGNIALADIEMWVGCMTDRIIAETLDPVYGVMPSIIGSVYPQSRFERLKDAYGFIATQNVDNLEDAITGLRSLENDTADGISRGLMADMMRVASNMKLSGYYYSKQQCVDTAESGLLLDPRSVTAQLAAGYAYLNADNAPMAASIAHILENRNCNPSEAHDTALLRILSLTPEELVSAPSLLHSAQGTCSFFEEVCEVVRLVRLRDLDSAESRLNASAHKNIFWTHLFQAVVRSALGETKMAQLSLDLLRHTLPRAEKVAASAVSGFFRDEDHDFITGELARLGFQIAR